MARRDSISVTDDGLLAFSDNFGRKLQDSPEAYSMTVQAVEAYMAKQAEFAERLQAARDPDTRGTRATFLKTQAKRQLMALTRQIARQINNLMSVSDDQRQELGLVIRDTTPSVRPRPQVSPQVAVRSITGRTITLELRHEGRRGKPEFVTGATVFAHIGEQAPASVDEWKFASATTRTRLTLPFPASPTGDTVWLTAQWRNAKDESGPACPAISVNLPAGGPLPQEMNEAPMLKAA